MSARQQRRKKNARAFKRERTRIGQVKGTKPARSKDYRRWVASLPCLMCWLAEWLAVLGGALQLRDLILRDVFVPKQTTNSEAAHSGPHGIGQKASDYDVIPLCHFHHQEAKDAQGKSRHWFEEHGLDREKIIAELRARYERERAA
jgi:hypothetical protein